MNLDGSEFVLGKEETKPFDITFPATEAGKFAGNLVIEYSETVVKSRLSPFRFRPR